MRAVVTLAVLVSLAAAVWAAPVGCRVWVMANDWDCAVGSNVTREVALGVASDGTYPAVTVGNELVTVKVEYPPGVRDPKIPHDGEIPLVRQGDEIINGTLRENTTISAGGASYYLWDLCAVDQLGSGTAPRFPTGLYLLYVGEEAFAVNVDNSAPRAFITQINGQAPGDVSPLYGKLEASAEWLVDENTLWVDWADDSAPNDSLKGHMHVQVYAKASPEANRPDRWVPLGTIPSPCNSHFVLLNDLVGARLLWALERGLGKLDVVAVAQDRFGNGDLSPSGAAAAFSAGRSRTVEVVFSN